MTVDSQNNKIDYNPDGLTSTFPYDFRVDEAGDMVVYADGALYAGGYTVTELTNPLGGNVIFDVDPPASIAELTLIREVPLTQETAYPSVGPFPAIAHEAALDKLTFMAQQLDEAQSRAATAPINADPATDYTLPPYREGEVWLWDTNTKSIVTARISDTEVGEGVQSIDSIAELKETGGQLPNEVRIVLGGASVGDDQGGQFYWAAASTATPDGLDIIALDPDVGVGRWLRTVTNTLARGEIKTKEGKRYQVLGGVIYYNTLAEEWRFLDNVDHQPIGFTGISTLANGEIQLNHDFGGVKTITLIVNSDETFSKLGITAGASVGIALSLITITAPLEFTVDALTGVVTAHEHWGTGVDAQIKAAVSPSVGQCVVTHPSASEAPSLTPLGVADLGTSDMQAGHTETTVDMRGISPFTGRIKYTGSAWEYSGDLYNTPTMSFSGGVLTVTHDPTDLYSLMATPGGAAGHRVAGSVASSTSFDLRFFNSAGALITSPDTNMVVYLNRRGRVRSNKLKGDFSVKRGYAQVDANNVFPTAGNFWLMGLIEYEV